MPAKKAATKKGSTKKGTTKGSGKRELIAPKGDKRYVRRDSKGRISEVGRQKWMPCVTLMRQLVVAVRTAACTPLAISSRGALAAVGDCRTNQ